MKKVMSVVVCAAVLGLVGCSSNEKPDSMDSKESVSQLDAGYNKTKCKHKRCHVKGKLGEEKVEKDTAK